MSDIYDADKRSHIMCGVKNKNTKSEIKVNCQLPIEITPKLFLTRRKLREND